MARPRKKGLSYFPLDIDFLKDDKFAFLISKVGAGAVTVVLSLWARMYQKEGPVKLCDVTLHGLQRETGLPIEAIESIVEHAKAVELLLEEETGALFSRAVAERIQEVTKERDRMRDTRTNKPQSNSEQITNKLEQTKNECEQTTNSVYISFYISISNFIEFKEGLETIKRDNPPDDSQVKLGPELRCTFTLSSLKRTLKFFKSKELELADFWRGIELLDAQLAKPLYAKKNHDHAACMTRWVYKALIEERASEARYKRANGSSTAASPTPSAFERRRMREAELFRSLAQKESPQESSLTLESSND